MARGGVPTETVISSTDNHATAPSRKGCGGRWSTDGRCTGVATARGVILAGREWQGALTQYVVGVEDGGIRAPRIEHAYGEHKFASVDDLFGSGHLPDSVCAMALAWIGAVPKAAMTGRLSA